MYPDEEYIFGDFTERLWAYLTILQLLEKRSVWITLLRLNPEWIHLGNPYFPLDSLKSPICPTPYNQNQHINWTQWTQSIICSGFHIFFLVARLAPKRRKTMPQPRPWTCLCVTALSPLSPPWWSPSLKPRMTLWSLTSWLKVRQEREAFPQKQKVFMKRKCFVCSKSLRAALVFNCGS